MYLYIATAPVYEKQSIMKLGFTEAPYCRLSTYQTGCPPGLTPSHDIEFRVIWKIRADDREEGFDCEEKLHNQFLKYRMMRNKPGDSEWFNFQRESGIPLVKEFMKTVDWAIGEISVNEISPPKQVSKFLKKQYHRNTNFVRSMTKRNEMLNTIQQPVIEAISEFSKDSTRLGGYIIAPCGSGKTLMTCRGIRGLKKVILCCPSNKIQQQWVSTLIAESVFPEETILTIGTCGTTDKDVIRTFLKKESYCVITTYASSHLFVDLISEFRPEILILDEAHHAAGKVGKEDIGEGRTRRLMMKATEIGVKRFSLTFTPRFVRVADESEEQFLTMDDESMFGVKVAELNLRILIRMGILPDYRIWSLRDETKKGSGLLGKAECILESWNGKEVVRGEEKFILHHLVVFAATIEEAKQLEDYFKEKTSDTLVLRVEGGDNVGRAIRKFTKASRSILVNCKVLGEGVDIPIANAVAVTYPKQSRGEITQMLLRAGRWFEGKPVFHILLPILNDEDMSGFEEVLTTLASCDEYIRDEIILLAASKKKQLEIHTRYVEGEGVKPECIIIEDYDGASIEQIKKCFMNARKNLYSSSDSKRIQSLCIERGIDTSLEYLMTLRSELPDLPEDPRTKGQTWYMYLHPSLHDRITPQEFIRDYVEPNNLSGAAKRYEEWRGVQPTDIRGKLPSTQNITDGYFGLEYINYNVLCEAFGKKTLRRGR